MEPSKVIIAGGRGTLGLAVASHMQQLGHEVTLLTRRLKPDLGHRQVLWDGKTVDPSWAALLPGSVLVNLAGELVDRVPTAANVDLLERSRVEPTKALVAAAKDFGAPKLWLQMSTLAIYGDAGQAVLDELSPPAKGPRQMAGVAKAWEGAAAGANAQRLVILRSAIVLQPDTPALNRLLTMTKNLMGGTVGSGHQWVSWIHIKDFLGALDFIGENENLSGVIHLTSPNPLQNRTMMAALRTQLGRPWTPPTPAWLVRLGARWIFKTDAQLGLTGRRAVPAKLLSAGFAFAFSKFDDALRDLLRSV